VAELSGRVVVLTLARGRLLRFLSPLAPAVVDRVAARAIRRRR